MRRLTNLSGNKRSVFIPRLNQEQLIDVHRLSHLKGEPAFEIIVALLAGRDKKICPLIDSRMELANEASKRLRRLQRVDKFIFDERGSFDLHLGWPILRGKLSDGTLIRAPLIFFPVTLEHDQSDWILKVRRDAGTVFNKTFLLAYYFFNDLLPDENLLEMDFEDFSRDRLVFRTQLYHALKDKLEINFNPDTFGDDLFPFQEFTKSEFDEKHRNGEIKLFPEALLGIFPQSGSQLVPDYLQLIDENKFASLEEVFASRNLPDPKNVGHDPVAVNLAVHEEKVYTPFALDAWQEHAIKSTKLGRSVVVQGPPGTGKSQLICNLISDGIASSKRVLLVSQKRVALDVVFNRLKKIDLENFIGLIHDFRNDRKDIYKKITTQIDNLEEYKSRNRGIDVIQTERKFVQMCRTIDRLVEELEEFRAALFTTKECGLSVKELYLTSNPQEEFISLTQEYQRFHFDDEANFVRKLKQYVTYAASFEGDDYVLKERKSFAQFTVLQRKELEKIFQTIPVFQEHISNQLKPIIELPLSPEDCESLYQRKADADEMVKLLADESVYRFFVAMADEKDDETSLLWLQNIERLILNCFEGVGVEKTLSGKQIGECQVALQNRLKARRNIFRLIRWELFSQHKFFLKRVLIANGLSYTKSGLRTLESRIDNRLNLEHHLTSLRSRDWLIDFPDDYSKKSMKGWFKKQKFGIRAKLLFSSLREIRQGILAEQYTRDEFIRTIWSVFDILESVPKQKSEWLLYVSNYQIRQLIRYPDIKDKLIETLHHDFDMLCAYDQLKESLTTTEREVINRVHDHVQRWDEDRFVRVFQNSLRLTWIEHMETKFPVLRSVSTLALDEKHEELMKCMDEKMDLCQEILLLRARENICESIEYNRLNNRVTYRDLHHQVTKKKKIWPVRKLIAEFHHEVFKLIPCWMASPESVSALFPMNDLFDLVIFDEASQCFAERGLPAIFRGKQLVVAGDSKQLQPYELYQSRWEDESETMELEIDSLLDLSSKYLEAVNLHGHYRSKSPELIDFSNHHFYSSKLKTLPDKNVLNQRIVPIQYHKVEGVWENQTNPVEAKAVVQTVVDLIHDLPGKEIGVVTFNMPQQMLITEMLENHAAENNILFPETLIVKNIENVQGDEKDIIIFSIGYAPDKKGRMVMQFGSLNGFGGENRLNVAVTRAREKVIVVASIWPENLKVSDLANEGPKLLRAYLEYAREVSLGNFRHQMSIVANHNAAWYLDSSLITWSRSSSTAYEFVIDNLPFTDVTLKQNQYAVGLLLTDDANYEMSLTAKEAHVYTPFILNQKNWTYLRIFSRNWWINREKVEHELARYQFQLNQSD